MPAFACTASWVQRLPPVVNPFIAATVCQSTGFITNPDSALRRPRQYDYEHPGAGADLEASYSASDSLALRGYEAVYLSGQRRCAGWPAGRRFVEIRGDRHGWQFKYSKIGGHGAS